MAEQQYQDPILKKYVDTITAATKQFKRVYYGDPIRIGTSELPALIIAKVDSRVSNLTNQEDRHELRISLTVVTDIRNTISDDKEMVRGVNSLYDIMEGRQEGTYLLKPSSLLYIIRHNVELDVGNNLRTDLNTMSRVDYGMTIDKRMESSWSIEGMLELTAHFTQNR